MNLQPFSQNPDKYLLYLNKNGNIESHKKGLITWIRSHITEKSNYDLKNILSKINKIGVDKLTDQEIYAINKSFYAHQTKDSNALPVWTEAVRHLAKNKIPDGVNTVTPHQGEIPKASSDSIQNALPTQKTEPIEKID